jgi:hypothetical protein
MKGKIIISFIFLITLFACYRDKGKGVKSTSGVKCNCETNPNLSEMINCGTTRFKNGSKLYRQFNCDSSWLTFESPKCSRKIMYSLDQSLMELTGQLGYQFVKEYQETLLFQNRQASGGGFPINFELISKYNGELIEDFGTVVCYSDDNSDNYILYLSDKLDEMIYYNVDTQTKSHYPIPKGRLEKTVKESSQMFAESLFNPPKKRNNILTLTYRYLVSTSPEKWNADTIHINLKTTKRID